MSPLVIAFEWEAALGAVFGRAIPMLAHADVGGENRARRRGRDRPRSPGLCTRGRIERSCYQTHNAGYLKG